MIRLHLIIEFLLPPQSERRFVCVIKTLGGLPEITQKAPVLANQAADSSVYLGKIEKPFSLFRRGRLKMLWAGFLA
ncbi:MAG TPA: hypothetical protein VJ864_07210 [Candidatus Binatia bacterium]|nr:hypothetical protein [Candidatus Binatia bacterium]